MQESRKAPIPKYNEVGSRIRELRVSHALSQKAFAQTLNMSQGHLSRVEKGAVISVALCALIAEKFNSTKEYLLFGVKEKPLGVTTSSVPVIPNPDTEFSGFSLDQTDSLV
ncbi:MAG TPA: helix-turn-helix transcriptional regulator, partial [Sphaerochaeta sp.]|nr:helix-turn-helix transcriptional regulator [Sphaerochaeta sp.]